MVSDGKYTIMQTPNKITILLPQTLHSIESTLTPIVNRKKWLSPEEESILLAIVKEMFEGERKEEER